MSTGALQEKVAVVTGAGQGIGRAIAERFGREGACVGVIDIDATNAQAVAKELTDQGTKAIGIACDVADRKQVVEAAALVTQQLGPIDVLVSNAGVTRPAMMWKMTDEQWQTVFDVHVNGTFYWLQAVIDGMRERRSGNIVITTSGAGLIGSVGQINYSAAKGALLSMTRSAARELAPYGVVVNAVAPAAATPMTETIRTDERFKDKYIEGIPMGRWAEASEIAGTYVYLASDDASYVTGQVIAVDGGRTMVR